VTGYAARNRSAKNPRWAPTVYMPSFCGMYGLASLSGSFLRQVSTCSGVFWPLPFAVYSISSVIFELAALPRTPT
jgi:hypothetical protein